MIIAVASGKGGTGKTTIAVNLAASLKNVQLLDCDVEEPNAHIFLRPTIEKTDKVYIPVPEINEAKCTYCGKCKEVCAYNAIAVVPPTQDRKGSILVFDNLCHGCGACSFFCPHQAITERDKEIGIVEKGYSGAIEFVHGKLNVGEAMAPPVIRDVKRYIDPAKTVIVDAPPGTSCPVVTSMKGSDFCLLVTEPTPFGLNDLVLAVEVVRKMNIPFGVVINRADLGDNKTEEFCAKENIQILMRIPFQKEIAQAYSQGVSIVEKLPEYKNKFLQLFETIKSSITN